jgi:hypothetical protein
MMVFREGLPLNVLFLATLCLPKSLFESHSIGGFNSTRVNLRVALEAKYADS